MIAATERRSVSHAGRLVHVDAPRGRFSHRQIAELPELLAPSDLLVVNDAATLPASLRVQNLDAELRLVGHGETPESFHAVLFGPGDFHTDTDLRPEAPVVRVNDVLSFGPRLQARVEHVDARSQRLITLRFQSTGAELWSELYRLGRPIQYRHVERPLELWDVQNTFAARPFAFEVPSAGLPLDHVLLARLKGRGVRLATLTHAAGISATGSAELDARLPLPERYEIPAATREAIDETRRSGGSVIAVGTSVVRALESNWLEHGTLREGGGLARLRLGPGYRRVVVDGLFTGIHTHGTSHFDLLEAFAPRALLDRVERDCERQGYLTHEFGDSCLIRAEPAQTARSEPRAA
ncbi:MAG: S-adenosylmethionine:tRNA ribosyltransferase-isomerase [Myxococcota bacterium]